MASTLPIEPREVLVDMNTAGSWRGLGCYDMNTCDIDAVLDAAETLVRNHKGLAEGAGKLRIATADGLKTPLMYWNPSEGWTEAPFLARRAG